MRDSLSTPCKLLLVAALVATWSIMAGAQGGATYKLGRAPSEHELRPWDASIRPDGEGLPAGSGTASRGRLSTPGGIVRLATGQPARRPSSYSGWHSAPGARDVPRGGGRASRGAGSGIGRLRRSFGASSTGRCRCINKGI